MKKTVLLSLVILMVWTLKAYSIPALISDGLSSISNVTVTPETRRVGIGNTHEIMLKVSVSLSGSSETVSLTSMTLNMGATPASAVDSVRIYTTGGTSQFDSRTLAGATLLGSCAPQTGDFTCPLQGNLSSGTQYLWITVDLSSHATEGQIVQTSLQTITTAEESYTIASAESGSREVLLQRTVLYRPGDYNSANYRIPAILTAPDGSLVAVTDKRKNNEGDLPQDIDIVCNRSTDGGHTWSAPYTIAQGTGYEHGYGDCALALTGEDSTLIAVFVGGKGLWSSTASNPIHSYMSKSTDNGRTWSTPTDITHFIFGSNCIVPEHRYWRASFFGSGNGLLTSTGRIIFVAAIREGSAQSLNNYAVYSDDHGQTWNVSQRASVGGDEAKVTELADGRILMSIRHAGARWYNISEDGGETWQATTSEWNDLIGPACNGDLIRYTSVSQGHDSNRLLHSLPQGNDRSNVTVYASYDEGETWSKSKCIVPYSSAYSSLCILPDGTIGLYVEEKQGEEVGYSTVFYNFSLKWLTDGSDEWVPTSIMEHSGKDDTLTIYPVPATSTIHIAAQDIEKITIFNAKGQRVRTIRYSGASDLQIDISDLAPGMYILESQSKDNIRKTGRFVR